jgi:two-component system response regulator YesN
MFMLAISIPTLIIGVISIQNSTQHIVDQSDIFSKNLLDEKKSLFEQKFSEITNVSNQILSSEEVWRLFDHTVPTIKKHQAMQATIFYLLNMSRSNEGLASIYLYNEDQDYVLSDAKYPSDEFMDASILKLDFPGATFLTSPRESHSNAADQQVVSYIRRFRDMATNETLRLIINVKYSQLVEKLQMDHNPYQLDLIIFNERNELILTPKGSNLKLDENHLKAIRNLGDSINRQSFDGEEYYFSKTESNKMGWTFMYLKPYSQLVGTAKLLTQLMVVSTVIVLALSFLLAFGLSKYLYKPLGNLIGEIRTSAMHSTDQKMDEYMIIDSVLKNLFHENRELQTQYAEAFPYMRQYTMQKLITGKILEEERIAGMIEFFGVKLTGTLFVIAVLEFEKENITDQMFANVETWMDSHSQSHFVTVMDEYHMVAVLSGDDDMYHTLELLLSHLNERWSDVTIAASRPFDSLTKAGVNYREAMIQFNQRFFDDSNRLHICKPAENLRQADFLYDRSYEEALLQAIQAQDEGKAHRVIRQLISSLPEQSLSIEYIKYGMFQFVSRLGDSLHAFGGAHFEEFLKERAILAEIHKVKSLQELEQYLTEFMRLIIDNIAKIRRSQHTETIHKAKAFIKANYHRDISIKDISEHVFLSPNYLGAIFKTETGFTIFDYTTQVRMDAAVDLLKNPSLKIQEISQAIGYKNVQSFNRFFKKAQKMTPLEYRRSIIES